jgi:hypothetical protein
MPPPDAIPVIPLESVVVIVISFTIGEKCQKVAVSCCVIRVVFLVAPNMGKGVDQECEMMVQDEAQKPGEQQATPNVAVPITNHERQEKVSGYCKEQIVPVLPHYDRVFHEVFDIAMVIHSTRVLSKDPANMGEPESTFRGIGISFVLVYESVVIPVIRSPVKYAVLQRTGTPNRPKKPIRKMCIVRFVGPQSVIPGCNGNAGQTHK